MKFRTDYRKLLDPKIVSKISSLDLRAKNIVEGFLIGLHKSPYHGFSVEFSEHRQYIPGDEIKDIDWKVYAKTDKFFIKQYEEETNLKSYIMIDTSKSMAYTSSELSKFNYAITLGAAFAYLLFDQNDAVGLVLYSDKINNLIEPRASKTNLIEILKVLAKSKPDGKTETLSCLNEISEKIKKRGLVIVISDLLDNLENTITALKKFRLRKNEVIVFHLLDPKEKTFEFSKDAIFKDLESNDEILTQPYQIRGSYRELFEKFIEKLKRELLNNLIDYNLITTDQTFDKALLEFLKKRKRLL